MKKILIQGICGRMGTVLRDKIAAREDCCVVGGIDRETGELTGGIPVTENFSDCTADADVLIDFSSPAAAVCAVKFCTEKKMPCVICTTGLSAEAEAMLHHAAATIPVFRSANMSLGVNVMIELAKKAAQLLGSDYDMEIIEKHHRNKLDAPSGTALMLADAVNEVSGGNLDYVYDRHTVRRKRDVRELGISSVRGGGIVGEHELLFCGDEETLTISHFAQSRAVFADGAIQAALFVADCKPGYYTMSELIQEKLQ